MKIVRKFQTDDGQEFTDQVKARQHEVEQEALGKLRNLLKSAIDSSLTRQGNVDNVLKNIIGEASEVSAILSSYRKKQPKETSAEARKVA